MKSIRRGHRALVGGAKPAETFPCPRCGEPNDLGPAVYCTACEVRLAPLDLVREASRPLNYREFGVVGFDVANTGPSYLTGIELAIENDRGLFSLNSELDRCIPVMGPQSTERAVLNVKPVEPGRPLRCGMDVTYKEAHVGTWRFQGAFELTVEANTTDSGRLVSLMAEDFRKLLAEVEQSAGQAMAPAMIDLHLVGFEPYRERSRWAYAGVSVALVAGLAIVAAVLLGVPAGRASEDLGGAEALAQPSNAGDVADAPTFVGDTDETKSYQPMNGNVGIVLSGDSMFAAASDGVAAGGEVVPDRTVQVPSPGVVPAVAVDRGGDVAVTPGPMPWMATVPNADQHKPEGYWTPSEWFREHKDTDWQEELGRPWVPEPGRKPPCTPGKTENAWRTVE